MTAPAAPIAVVTGGAGFIGSHMVDLLRDRGIAVRVVVPHYVARNLCRFTEAARRGQPQLAHGIKDPAVHRFQPIANIR